MGHRPYGVAAALSLALLAGCAHGPKRPRQQETPWHPPTAMLLPYVASDGSLTRAQMETGLRRDFNRLDTSHTGCLNDDQVRAINDQRWKQDASTATPLIDFKYNGCVDFEEFAAAPRSLFDQLDKNGDGKLTPDELRPGTGKGGNSPDQPNQGRRHRGGDDNPPSGN